VNFSGATVNGKRPIGAISDFRVWVVPGMPDNYGFGFKSYGPNNPRNPLRVRVPEGSAPRNCGPSVTATTPVSRRCKTS
jgi:hypothetical protein